jgi:hypothetical protein
MDRVGSTITRSGAMGTSRLVEVARQSMDAVVARAGELADGTGAQASATGEALLDLAASARQQIADVAAEAQQVSIAKLEQAIADVNAALPLFREAGYVLEGLRIQLGLAPQLQADFTCDAVVSDEKVEAMLEAHAERALTTMLIRAMRHASKLQAKMSFGGLRPAGLSATVGIPPQVVVKFSPAARRDATADAPADALS